MNESVPVGEPVSNRPGNDELPRIGPLTAVATKFGWAVDVIARMAAADAVAHISSRHQRRALPPAVNNAVCARFAELADTMRPSHEEFEAAFDIAVHGIGKPV